VKALVFLLVLANLLFYAFSEGYFGRPENPDAGRVEKQVLPERMRIVSRGEVPVAPVKVVEPEAESAVPEVVPEAAKAESPKAEPAKEEPAMVEPMSKAKELPPVCLAWEHLSVTEADRVNALLSKRFAEFKVTRPAVGGEGNSWWVFMAPLPGKAEAEKKAGELRLFGVTDYFIIPDGPNRFAISLGVFSSEKGGQERLAEVKEKGVRSARLMLRPSKDGTVNLQVNGPATAKPALLAAVGKVLPKSTPQSCK